MKPVLSSVTRVQDVPRRVRGELRGKITFFSRSTGRRGSEPDRPFHTWLVITGSWLLLSLPASAQSDKPFAAPTAAVTSAPAGAASLTQVTISLLLVLAAVFAAAWVVRRLRGLGRFGAQAITVIADVGLGPKERAVLVQVGSQQLLLGVTPGGVSMLHVLAEPVAAAGTTSATAAAQVALPPDFKAILKRSLGLK